MSVEYVYTIRLYDSDRSNGRSYACSSLADISVLHTDRFVNVLKVQAEDSVRRRLSLKSMIGHVHVDGT